MNKTDITVSEEFLDKLGNAFTHPLFKEIYPELQHMTFDDYVNSEIRRRWIQINNHVKSVN